VRDLLIRRVQPTKEMINAQINIELSYINTNHPDFIGGSRAVSTFMERAHEDGKLPPSKVSNRPLSLPPLITLTPSLLHVILM
jgi:dynamin 1-like protein